MSDLSFPRHARPAIPADLTQPATQIVANRASYLGESQVDVGQRIADDRLELFVHGEPALAIQQQFAAMGPEFIALHDIGTASSLRLVSAVAAALGTKLQQLTIRRQGHGVALATLRFAEVPVGNKKLRIYTTDVDSDSQSRRALANVLLSNSRLAALMVGELPPHVLSTALQPIRDAISAGPWLNRHLLLVPTGSPGALAAQAETLVGQSRVTVRVSAPAPRANEAWNHVSAAWKRLHTAIDAASAEPETPYPQSPGTRLAPTAGAHAAPAPVPASAAERSAGADGRWTGYLQQCLAIKGLASACVFDLRTQRPLGQVGSRPAPQRLAEHGAALVAAMTECSHALGLGHGQPDATISLSGHHLLLHPLPGQPNIVLHAVLDASSANLAQARMHLQRVDSAVLGAAIT